MADYTKLTAKIVKKLISGYDLGKFESMSPLDGGQANSSMKITTRKGIFTLSVCDEKNQDEIQCLTQVLAYLETHREVERQHANYRYVPLTTREPENLDSSRDDYVGKQYLQDEFSSDDFAEHIGWEPEPENTHVYLCGNPSMIGLPKKGPEEGNIFPEPEGMVELLTHAGFTLDEPNRPGNIHFEKYW